jgi:putative sigma-54 modulation protein
LEVKIHARNLQVSEDIRAMAADKIAHAARFFDGKVGLTDVEFSEEQNPRIADRYRVEITSAVAGHVVRVNTSHSDQQAAVDLAVDRFERQLRKLKERLIGRSRTDEHKRLNEASGDDEVTEESSEMAAIVRTKQFTMKPMSPQEAALQMEMLGHSFFLFLNSENDSHAVLYRRRDGQLGLIETA